MEIPKRAKRFTGLVEPWNIHKELSRNLSVLKELFKKSDDVVFRDFFVKFNNVEKKGVIIYIEGLINSDVINRDILERIVTVDFLVNPYLKTDAMDGKKWMKEFIERCLSANNLSPCETITEVKDGILNAQAVLLIDGIDAGIVAGVEGFSLRGIDEPDSGVVIRGPREGFIENLRTNTALIRRKIRSHHLKGETITVGRKTNTKVCLVYLDDTVNHEILKEVKERIHRIEIDAILESGYIEELIEDNPFSPFPSMSVTERPDEATAAILEGRIAIIIDNTPFVLILPMVFQDLLHVSEDYYNRYTGGTMIRIIRFIALFISLFLPSLYIGVVTFHPEMLPTPLLISIAAAREGVPFPVIIEAFLMEFTFEALKEAGARMPKAIGSTVSIVGALILGEAAVSAGLVSQPMVIVVAGTAIAAFAIPGFGTHAGIRFIRFIFLILAGIFGLYGVIIGLMFMLLHLCSMRSFGVPYMAPFAPLITEDLKDSIVRAPWWSLKYRPQLFNWRRQRRNKTPRPTPPIVVLCLCILSGMFLTGCWNMEEINNRAIIGGIGIDKIKEEEDKENQISMTVQIIKPGVVAGASEGGGGGNPNANWILDTEGKSVFEAARNLVRYSGRQIYWGHNQVVVIGEELAREGVGTILDFFDRTPENRLRTWFIVVKGEEAKKVLSATPHLESLLAVELSSMLQARRDTSFAAAINLRDFLFFLSIPSRAPVASAVEVYTDADGKESLLITGSAVFDRDKLIDFYDENLTRGILWVVGDVDGAVIPVDWDGIVGAITARVLSAGSKIKTDVENGQVNVTITIDMKGKITEIEEDIDLRSLEALKSVEDKVADSIKSEIEKVIEKAKEDKVDIFGIGEHVRRQNPREWKEISQDWKEIFPDINFQVQANVKIKRYGVTRNVGISNSQ
ncbi:hypothetical protein BHU72_03675 [Desulfuribacillus stibiiarsenatis]|uniref:Uncharacterized protein n=1 Tax=Desulfuribacillus stibiiarsenatis TaxID=1390249 RepID=A0A1E5L7E3_9FIRM|nr:Ger(x)C family spore germination protein [Desulfuribacillus stibiiarsenatis]OEH85883.1 hypothetical protein BHU72_03675 [Desulfuribacillus stibiiarsenatis]